jgi:hypothetical protein
VRQYRKRKGFSVRDHTRGGRVSRFVGEYKGRLTYRKREQLPDSDFAVILADGTRKYPIENKAHARNALARVDRFGNSEEKAAVRAAVARRYPSIKQAHDPPPRQSALSRVIGNSINGKKQRANGGAGHFGIFRRNDDPNR